MSKKNQKADQKTENIAANQAEKPAEEIVQTPAADPTTIAELWARVDARLSAIEAKLAVKIKEGNGRGPLSTRSMTVDDAKRIMTGDLKDASIKSAAQELGLSYGQVYSARGGYTFKDQYAARVAAEKAAKNAKK